MPSNCLDRGTVCHAPSLYLILEVTLRSRGFLGQRPPFHLCTCVAAFAFTGYPSFKEDLKMTHLQVHLRVLLRRSLHMGPVPDQALTFALSGTTTWKSWIDLPAASPGSPGRFAAGAQEPGTLLSVWWSTNIRIHGECVFRRHGAAEPVASVLALPLQSLCVDVKLDNCGTEFLLDVQQTNSMSDSWQRHQSRQWCYRACC